MTKQNITYIVFSLIMSLFLFTSVSTVQADSAKSASVSIEKGESVKQVVQKMTKALAKKGYKLQRGNAKHIGKVARRGIEIVIQGGRPRIECDYWIFNCRMEDL